MADNGGPSRPRGRLGAFNGGPFGIGWAPWAIGAGALALGIFFFMRRGSASAQQAQAQGPGALPLGTPYPYPTGAAPTGGSNPSAQQLASQIQDTPLNYADWQKQSSGYLYGPQGNTQAVFNKGGRGYFYLSDPGAAQAYTAGGGQLYFFPVPGQPVSTTYGQAAPGTPAYGAGPAVNNPSAQQLAGFSGSGPIPLNLAS